MQDVNLAARLGVGLRDWDGVIECEGRKYRVSPSDHKVNRVFDEQRGLICRVANATKDLFVRRSLSTRAQFLENAIFNKVDCPPIPFDVKADRKYDALNARIDQIIQNCTTAGIDTTRVKREGGVAVFLNKEGKAGYESTQEKGKMAASSPKSHVTVLTWLHKVKEKNEILGFAFNPFERDLGHNAVKIVDGKGQEKYFSQRGNGSAYSKASPLLEYNEDFQDQSNGPPKKGGVQDATPTQREGGTPATSEIYIPFYGSQKKMFGLDLQKAGEIYDELECMNDDGTLNYRLVSKKWNCAGVVMQVLMASGAERFYAPPNEWFYYTPSEVHQYARQLQRLLDFLNDKAESFIAQSIQHDKSIQTGGVGESASPTMPRTPSGGSLSTVSTSGTDAVNSQKPSMESERPVANASTGRTEVDELDEIFTPFLEEGYKHLATRELWHRLNTYYKDGKIDRLSAEVKMKIGRDLVFCLCKLEGSEIKTGNSDSSQAAAVEKKPALMKALRLLHKNMCPSKPGSEK